MRVRFQEGVIDLFYFRVGLEPLSYFQCGGVLVFDAEGEGFEASEEQIAAVRVEGAAHRFVEVSDFVDELASAEHGAGEDVVVAC